MRLRGLEAPGDWAISDQAVLVPRRGQQVPDLSFIGTGCTIVADLDDLPAHCLRAAVLHDRAESVLEVLRWMRAVPGRGVDLVMSEDWENLLNQLVELDPCVALDRFGWSCGHLVVGMTAPRDEDPPATDFLQGLTIGLCSHRAPGHGPEPSSGPRPADLERLHSLVEFIAQHPGLGRRPDPAPALDATDRAVLVRLRNDHDALERRYAALAGSRLGSLTLRYWRWRRARR